MKKPIILIVLLMYSLTSFSVQYTITNVGLTFSPSSLTILPGDNVTFVLESIHDAVEVSQATWNANGTTPLAGGFSIPFGGGAVPPAQLTNGTHWYVCTVHASSGMKGIIIVGTPTGIGDNPEQKEVSIFPNPAMDLITVNTGNNLLGARYCITDQHGNLMITGKIAGETTSFDISRFRNGIYLFQVAGLKRRSFKIIKN